MEQRIGEEEMTDQELLMLAAKAAVITGYEYNEGTGNNAYYAGSLLFMTIPGIHTPWNPLTDDGDALRLAVQCGLEVSLVDDEPIKDGKDTTACVGYSLEGNDKVHYVFEYHGGDIFAATRLAIVRAAAEIGKSMP